jgi:hypothetical protein
LLVCDTVVVLRDGAVAIELDARVVRKGPRRQVVTSSPFLELRERALEAIG